MPKCPKCGAPYEGHPARCPGCGVKFVFKPAQTVIYQRTSTQMLYNNRCPKCNSTFKGHPSNCPRCGVQLLYMEVAVAAINNKLISNGQNNNVDKENASYPAKVENLDKQNLKGNDLDLRFVDHPLKTNRGVFKFFFLNIITLTIYSFVYFHKWSKDLNRIRRYYGDLPRLTYVPAFFLGLITLGIVPLIFFIRRTSSTYRYARKEGVACGSSVFWFLSNFIILSWTIVCPIIAAFQIVRTMNRLCKTLNSKTIVKPSKPALPTKVVAASNATK